MKEANKKIVKLKTINAGASMIFVAAIMIILSIVVIQKDDASGRIIYYCCSLEK